MPLYFPSGLKEIFHYITFKGSRQVSIVETEEARLKSGNDSESDLSKLSSIAFKCPAVLQSLKLRFMQHWLPAS